LFHAVRVAYVTGNFTASGALSRERPALAGRNTEAAAMSPFSRFLLRLHQQLLRCYEVGMLLVLLAVALAAVVPAAADAEPALAYCGKNQSSAAVMHR
jgi:hypothetical protein